jgi:beta-galactosidase
MTTHRPSARATTPHANHGPNLTRSGLRVGTRVVPLLSAALHYFRLSPARWRRALESVRELGFELVETYVPWGEHELAEGRYDFGQHDRQKDLGAFLDLAHELGLFVFLRPGPNVNAELPNFGLPRRIVLDERNQARSARGQVLPVPAPPRMFPAPSYASANFRAETERWFRAVAEVAAPRCWPKGPIVLLQVDNEIAFFFRDAPYDSDYHPDALAAFERFLEQRFASIAALNADYGTTHASFGEVPAPRKFALGSDHRSTLLPLLDWVAFHEALLSDALGAMTLQLAAAGLVGLPLSHNLPMGEGGLPATVSVLERSVDLVGLDYYHGRGNLEAARKRTLRLAGSSRLPFAPELGAGAPPWFGARTELDGLYSAICACAYGLRGFSLYMTVDRDRWQGAPIDPDGEPRAGAEPWRRFVTALKEVGFHALRRRVEVALSIPKEYAQLSRAMHALGPLSPSLLDLAGLSASAACRWDRFGFEEPIQIAWEQWLARLDRALCDAQIPFVYVESDADLELQPELKLIFAPGYEFADLARWQRLQRFGARGGTVICGPQWPRLDSRLRSHPFEPPALPAHVPAAPLKLPDQAAANARVRELIGALGLSAPISVSPLPLQATLHEDEAGPRAIFVMNPGPGDVRAELRLPSALRLYDPLSGERFEASGSALELTLLRQSCRMLVVEAGRHAE